MTHVVNIKHEPYDGFDNDKNKIWTLVDGRGKTVLDAANASKDVVVCVRDTDGNLVAVYIKA